MVECGSHGMSAANPWDIAAADPRDSLRSSLGLGLSLFTDAIQVIHRANENLPVRDRRRSVAFIAQRITAHDIELSVPREDVGDAHVIAEVNVPVGEDRRCAV